MSEFWQGAMGGCGLGVLVTVVLACVLRSRAADRAYIEGRDVAIANAAMKAYDMGHKDVHGAINALVERGR
jgi:hypothetical protein